MTVWSALDTIGLDVARGSTQTRRVATDCLYPGGMHVSVSIDWEGTNAIIGDDGMGWDTLRSAGLDPTRSAATRAAQTVGRRFGVSYIRGVFLLKDVTPEQVHSAVLHVANASQAWVTSVFALGTQLKPSIADRSAGRLQTLFGPEALQRNLRVQGFSSRTHQLAFFLPLTGGRNAILEPVADRIRSIASVYMKFADIARLHPDWPREVLVENAANWASADLSLLSEVATGITDIDADLAPLGRKLRA